MYHTIESLAESLGVSTLVLQRRAVKLGIWTQQGIADEDVQRLEFLRQATIVDATIVDAVVEEQQAEDDDKLVWYGEFLNGKPLYRRANEKPASKGTVAEIPLWSHAIEGYTQPEFKVKGDKDFNSVAR